MKVHLGCANRFIPGFIHVDLVDLPHIDHIRDVRWLDCFADSTVSLIYASHVLEYFDELEVIDVLREWRRVLKPGGLLRLSVPKFNALVEVYQQTNSVSAVLGPLYGRMETSAGLLYHKMVYTFDSLSTLLRAAGYRAIRYWDWRQTEHSEIDDCSQAYWPHMDKENGILISLNVEAERIG